MKIKSSVFNRSATDLKSCPQSAMPEVAFIGRSNVGKSSAINAIVGQNGLCRTSGTPGRTQAINLFQLDDRWIAQPRGERDARGVASEVAPGDDLQQQLVEQIAVDHCW